MRNVEGLEIVFIMSAEIADCWLCVQVQVILRSQKVTTKIGSGTVSTDLYPAPNMRPVYLQLAKS